MLKLRRWFLFNIIFLTAKHSLQKRLHLLCTLIWQESIRYDQYTMHKNWLFAIGMVFGWTFTAWSQHLPGASMGNYAGTNALYHNPAFVADSRYRVYVNVAATQLYTANNHVRYEAPFSFFNLLTAPISKPQPIPGGLPLGVRPSSRVMA